MNERIQELEKQAWEFVDKTWNWANANNPSQATLFKAKFAELIVRECMNIVSNQTTLDTNEDFREGFNHGLKYAWTDIRKHFGVE
jgi:hypothetical protein